MISVDGQHIEYAGTPGEILEEIREFTNFLKANEDCAYEYLKALVKEQEESR